MLTLIVAGSLAAIAAIYVAPKLLGRRTLVALGIAVAVIGAAAVGTVEWRYAPANTLPVQMPVALDRAAAVRTPPFRVTVAGPYDLWLEFDRKQDGEDFACLTGDAGAEAVCPRKDPDLAVAWTVSTQSAPIASGSTHWDHWHAVQAALDPAEAARRRKAYTAWQARSLDPSNNWPLYYRLGSFAAEAGRAYVAALDVQKPAGALAALHPRLAIGLGSAATKGLGTMALIFCLLCLVTGAGLMLRAIPRGRP
jgi:hypothetical protein